MSNLHLTIRAILWYFTPTSKRRAEAGNPFRSGNWNPKGEAMYPMKKPIYLMNMVFQVD